VAGNDTRSSGKEQFDYIVLANGFGLEQHVNSYWRNESFGQPSLNGAQKIYVVSGMGDGAVIDLLRLSFLEFRPDRFIDEAIENHGVQIKDFKDRVKKAISGKNKFEELIKIKNSKNFSKYFVWIKEYLQLKSRVDTKVVLHFKEDMGEFSDAFEKSPATILNKLLLFVAFDTGIISLVHDLERPELRDAEIIRRHGVNRVYPIKEVLAGKLFHKLAEKHGALHVEKSEEGEKTTIDDKLLENNLRKLLAQEVSSR
jgi:hypothetical protein